MKSAKQIALENLLAEYSYGVERDSDLDEWDDITKDESPAALEVARRYEKVSRSGEYLRHKEEEFTERLNDEQRIAQERKAG